MKNLIYILMLLVVSGHQAQTGNIKGVVIDKQSELPLEGATIELLNLAEGTGVITDFDGRFILEEVPVGRHSIRISYIGFETNTVSDILVSSGKDIFLKVGLLEAFNQLEEVVLSTETNQDGALNEMTKVSVRQFGVEEVTRFAGGRADVGRLAANFAGVSTPNDGRNDIVVRGNSPSGLLWRLEGIPIPSPNHFATAGTTGSPVSALNPNMLANSDFITSAFPAEYGNTIGGVFDLDFRNGNIDDYEFSAQLGIFSGVELDAEGPFGKKNGSFLVAGRYSFIGLIGAGGAGGTSAVPNYHDISFNLDLGSGKAGNLFF
ncbi:TonB-dependent receptor, partial [Aequorivita sp. SDUM287046]